MAEIPKLGILRDASDGIASIEQGRYKSASQVRIDRLAVGSLIEQDAGPFSVGCNHGLAPDAWVSEGSDA